ncbi:uncharacterized protein [Drosophila pseudoobscura]|uniref:Regulatory protein zeste n=1 Tax=Drosophila pseudoobscura pseudoobscura TaxID=46245 RepID=A0A6I8V385_DROPS|nr:uncharacterized protein LOC6897757 [Drosophila pseudoobscura]
MGKHKTSIQDDIMVEFMKDNPQIARGFVKGDRAAADAKWSKLTKALNAAGPPTKDPSGWKKVWSDWKIMVRKKLVRNKQEVESAGGQPYSLVAIQPIEEEIASLCGFFAMVNGVGGGFDFGTPIKQEVDQLEESPLSPISTTRFGEESEAEAEPRAKRARPSAPPLNLENLCSLQAETLNSVAETLKEMKEQQSSHFKALEEIEREKLEVLKKLLD